MKYSSILFALILSFQVNAIECDFYELESQVMIDDQQMIEKIVKSCSNLEELTNVYGENLLFTAVRYSSWNALDAFKKAGFSFHKVNSLSQNLLHYASDHQIAKYLIEHNVELAQTDRYSRTPLSMALEREDLSIASLMLNYLNTASISDLEWAADHYKEEVLEFLANNIPADRVEGKGHFFRSFFFSDPNYRAIAHTLVQKGADINLARSIRTRRPILEVYVEEFITGRHSQSEAIHFLLENGADPNLYVVRGAQSLLARIISRHGLTQSLPIIESMLKAGLNVKKLHRNQSILMEISRMRSDKSDYVDYLVKKDPQLLNIQNDEGMTALHTAIRWQNTELVRQLISLNANTLLRNHDSLDALEYAESRLRRVPDTRSRQALVSIIREIRGHRAMNSQ